MGGSREEVHTRFTYRTNDLNDNETEQKFNSMMHAMYDIIDML